MNPDRLHFTGNDDADRLLAEEPLALLIGFALDQQVTVPTAFLGPQKLKERLGKLDAKAIAEMDPAELEAAFREKPAVHRFPGNMARRVQELCADARRRVRRPGRARVERGGRRRRPAAADRRRCRASAR